MYNQSKKDAGKMFGLLYRSSKSLITPAEFYHYKESGQIENGVVLSYLGWNRSFTNF